MDSPYLFAGKATSHQPHLFPKASEEIDAVHVFEAARFRMTLPRPWLFKVQQERHFTASGVATSRAPLSTGLSSLSTPAGLLSMVLCGRVAPGRAPLPGRQAWTLENVSKAGGEIGGNRRWNASLSDHSPPMGQRHWAFGIFKAERKGGRRLQHVNS